MIVGVEVVVRLLGMVGPVTEAISLPGGCFYDGGVCGESGGGLCYGRCRG